MELLLNLAWLLLTLPAFWLWRRGAGARLARRVSSQQCLWALGCVVVLLFPVISATDDLHAMRSEMEESASSKRNVRQAGSDKTSAWVHRLQSAPALQVGTVWLVAPEADMVEIFSAGLPPLATPSAAYAGRAPPIYLLG
jgi:hypothetical protein